MWSTTRIYPGATITLNLYCRFCFCLKQIVLCSLCRRHKCFHFGKNLRKLINTLHIELDKLYAWVQSNKLTLDLFKTHCMVFHRAKHKHMGVKLCINKVPIQQVDNTNFLGKIIYENLNWSNHISYINSKIAKELVLFVERKVLLKIITDQSILCIYISVPYLLCRGMG